MSRIDDAVRRILRVKFRAGLFEHPYVDQAKALSVFDGIKAQSTSATPPTYTEGCTIVVEDPQTTPLPLPSTRNDFGFYGQQRQVRGRAGDHRRVRR